MKEKKRTHTSHHYVLKNSRDASFPHFFFFYSLIYVFNFIRIETELYEKSSFQLATIDLQLSISNQLLLQGRRKKAITIAVLLKLSYISGNQYTKRISNIK